MQVEGIESIDGMFEEQVTVATWEYVISRPELLGTLVGSAVTIGAGES